MDAIYGYHFLLSVRLPTEFPTAFPTVYVRLSNRHPCRVWVPSTPPEKSMSQCLCSRNPHSVLVPSTPPEKEHAAVPLLQTSCSVWVPSTPPEKSMSQCLCSRPLVLSHVHSLALGSSLVRPFVLRLLRLLRLSTNASLRSSISTFKSTPGFNYLDSSHVSHFKPYSITSRLFRLYMTQLHMARGPRLTKREVLL